MESFPRTDVGGTSLSRMIIGTNWFLGYCHSTRGQSKFMERVVTNRDAIAGIICRFLDFGVDTIYCPHTETVLPEAIAEAEQRSGKPVTVISTPAFTVTPETAERGFDLDEVRRKLDAEAARGTRICMPHVSTTDRMVDKCTRRVRHMEPVCRLVRERGMLPGLSTHTPETILFADESDLDVETYCLPFNSAGFLMHVEVDWTARVVQNARRPVLAIKTMAAGQIRPYQALVFAWNALRDRDLVVVGTASPEEAEELATLSLDILARRASTVELQATRSKATLKG